MMRLCQHRGEHERARVTVRVHFSVGKALWTDRVFSIDTFVWVGTVGHGNSFR